MDAETASPSLSVRALAAKIFLSKVLMKAHDRGSSCLEKVQVGIEYVSRTQ